MTALQVLAGAGGTVALCMAVAFWAGRLWERQRNRELLSLIEMVDGGTMKTMLDLAKRLEETK